MQLKDICVSLDLAKQLKEAGYPQESLFYWSRPWHNKPYELNRGGTMETADEDSRLSAPTSSEIGEKLPGEFATRRITKGYIHDVDRYKVYNLPGSEYHHEFADSEANARAKMWLFLKKNNQLPTNGKKE